MRITVAGICALLMLIVATPAFGQAARPECVKALEERQKVVQELNKLDEVTLPSDRIKELKSVIEELKAALSGTATDAKGAAEKIDKAIEKVKSAVPGIEDPLKKIAKGLRDGKSKMEDVVKALEKIGAVLDEFDRNYQTLESGSAEQQVRDLGRVFDTLKGALPDVPGISDMLNIYSKAIGAIADSVAKIEAKVKEANDLMRELQKSGSGDDIGIAPVYIKAEGPRANLARHKLALQKLLDGIDAKIDVMGCQRPGSPLTPTYSAGSCPRGSVRAALEIAKREIARRGLDRKLDEAAAKQRPADDDVALAKVADDEHKQQVERDRNDIHESERVLAAVEGAIRREQYEESVAQGEKAAGEHRNNRIKLERQDLPNARRSAEDARAKLAKDEADAPKLAQALDAARQKRADLQAEIEDLRRQIGEVVRNVLAQAAAADKWDDVDYGTLALCRDNFFVNDRVVREFTKDKIESARKDLECRTTAPGPSGGGMTGRLDIVPKKIDAAGCR